MDIPIHTDTGITPLRSPSASASEDAAVIRRITDITVGTTAAAILVVIGVATIELDHSPAPERGCPQPQHAALNHFSRRVHTPRAAAGTAAVRCGIKMRPARGAC